MRNCPVSGCEYSCDELFSFSMRESMLKHCSSVHKGTDARSVLYKSFSPEEKAEHRASRSLQGCQTCQFGINYDFDNKEIIYCGAKITSVDSKALHQQR